MAVEYLRLELFVEDIEKSLDFYVNALGFDEVSADDSTYRPLKRGRVELAIQVLDELPIGHPFAQKNKKLGIGCELVLEVNDVEQDFARVRDLGFEVVDLTEQPWGQTDFRVHDPDGYYWRLTGPSTP